jgi:hypothetical protein
VAGGGLKAKIQQLLARQRKNGSFPYLIQIEYEDGGRTVTMNYVNEAEDITFEGKVYNAASFHIEPPGRDGDKIGDATLTISAIDQFWIQKIRAAQKPAKLLFIAVVVYEDGSRMAERMEEMSFTLRVARFNEMSITWTMVFDERMSIVVPSDACNAMTTPGCA